MRLLLLACMACLLMAVSTRAQACEALLGSYAARPAGPALLQIVRHTSGFLLLQRDKPSQPWQVLAEPLTALSGFTLQSRIFPDMPLDSCALISGNRLFIATRPGFKHAVNSIAPHDTGTHINGSGFLIHETGETGINGQDLYRVASTGPAPTLPPQRAKLPAADLILPTDTICPGNQAPNLRQDQWQNLPPPLKQWFGRMDAITQQDVICGQWLYSALLATRQHADTLQRQTALINAGQTPLNWQGQSAWWPVARHLLLQRQPLGQPLHQQPHAPPKAVPLSDHFALLQDVVMPRLARQWQEGRTNQREAILTLIEILTSGDELALPALRVLDALGVLQWEAAMPAPEGVPGPPLARMVLQRAMLPDVSLAVFGFLLGRSGAPDANALQALIEQGTPEKLAWGLQHGLDPGQWDALGLARELHKPDMAALLVEALRQRGYAVPAN
jgi:hypothetical protein